MNKLAEWGVAQSVLESKNRRLIIGLLIVAFICLAIVGAVVKLYLLKKYIGCNCNCTCGTENDFEDFCDDEGCCVANEKDFA